MKHVFLLGSNGIPAAYGGFETFVDRLVAYKKSPDLQYHVSCLSDKTGDFIHNGAHCFEIRIPKKAGAAKAIYYDLASLEYCCRYIRDNRISNAVVYMLGCGLGPFINHYIRKLHRLGAKFYVNPDGLEWERGKWKNWIKAYLKFSAKQMVLNADLAVCDSEGIERYFHEEFPHAQFQTTFIAYGAETTRSSYTVDTPEVKQWLSEKQVSSGKYYLAVGRFVPENNFETMLRGFQQSHTDKDFVLITNVTDNPFYEQLKQNTGFTKDPRIKFVGTVYDQELLKYLRENAFAYIHGHEVGGTNPSLLESLSSTKINLLLDVGFNREVGRNGAVYWEKDPAGFAQLVDDVECWPNKAVQQLSSLAQSRITEYYNWDNIVGLYEKLFEES